MNVSQTADLGLHGKVANVVKENERKTALGYAYDMYIIYAFMQGLSITLASCLCLSLSISVLHRKRRTPQL
jgi:hypothetical protein